MNSNAARVHFIACPHCKVKQYFIYPNTKKVCAEPTCAKEFDIIYDVQLLRQVVDQLLKDIDEEAKTPRTNSKPLKHTIVNSWGHRSGAGKELVRY